MCCKVCNLHPLSADDLHLHTNAQSRDLDRSDSVIFRPGRVTAACTETLHPRHTFQARIVFCAALSSPFMALSRSTTARRQELIEPATIGRKGEAGLLVRKTAMKAKSLSGGRPVRTTELSTCYSGPLCPLIEMRVLKLLSGPAGSER